MQEGENNLGSYSGCPVRNEGQGPEIVYRLVVSETKRIRAVLTNPYDGDAHLHLLRESATSDSCVGSGVMAYMQSETAIIHKTLAPGVYYLVVDSHTDSPKTHGDFVFTVTECLSHDLLCDP